MWLGIVVASRCGCFKLRGHLFFGLFIVAARFSRFLRCQPSGVGVAGKISRTIGAVPFLGVGMGFRNSEGAETRACRLREKGKSNLIVEGDADDCDDDSDHADADIVAVASEFPYWQNPL